MAKSVLAVLVLLLMTYLAVMTKLVKSIDNFKESFKDFSFVDFFKVFRGRVYEDNLIETFVALSILITVAFLGITYVLIWVVDLAV